MTELARPSEKMLDCIEYHRVISNEELEEFFECLKNVTDDELEECPEFILLLSCLDTVPTEEHFDSLVSGAVLHVKI